LVGTEQIYGKWEQGFIIDRVSPTKKRLFGGDDKPRGFVSGYRKKLNELIISITLPSNSNV